MQNIKNNNKKKLSHIKPEESGFVNVRIRLNHKVHQVLMFESLQSRMNGTKKLLPEIINDRIVRDLENYPVKIDN